MSRQGQEQRFAGTFQAELKATNHQTTLSSKNEATLQMPSQRPVDSLEDLLSKWDKIVMEVKQQVNANDEDFQLFTNFNRSYLDSEWAALFQLIKYRKINYDNISSYLSPEKQKLETLYASFLQIKQEFPSSLEPFRHPLMAPPLPVGCNAACTNMDFSTGNFLGWNGYYGVNNSTTLAHAITGITGGVLGAVVKGAWDRATSSTYQAHITSSGNKDWFLSNYHSINMSQASPWGSGHSAMIGDSINNGKGVAVLSQEFEVTPTTNSITYAYSVFLENPAHSYYQQPFFTVVLFDQNGDTIRNCGVYNVVSGSNIPGFTGEYYPPDSHETSGGAGGDTIYWRPWTQVNVPLTDYVGQCVTIQFEVGDCALGGHCGYAYVDASCSTFTITASSPAICHNGTDNLTGPSGETHYAWFGPANGIITNDTLQTITIDSGGTYTLVVTPVTGGLCKDTLTITIPRDKITTTAIATSNSCSDIAGSATATTLNGYAPYTYAWSPSGGTNTVANGLSNGTYTVIATDKYGCEASATATITQSPALTESATILSNISCSGGDASATATVSGGRSPYNYVWNPSGQTTASASGLSAGNYTITATDANGCTATSVVTITQPAILTVATSTTSNVSCNGDNNGSANATTGGGTSPYRYSWNPSGEITASATGLSAGNYTVTITDANGCTKTSTATITQPTGLNASVATTSNASCNGDANGSASVVANGGTSPYRYSWNPSSQTSANATGLSAGNYNVVVTDANGCTVTSAVTTITQPFALSASATATSNVSCNGNNNGSATVTVSGGTSPYRYIWNPSSQTSASVTGLSAGNYNVVVTDANGCTVTSSTLTITQPNVLSATAATIANVSCNGNNNGSASVSVNGGTSPYNYLWNPSGQTTATVNGLGTGVYTITVTDANGCTASSVATTTQPAILTVATATTSNVSCNGDNNGSVSVIANGGTSPYRYSWNPSSQTSANATGLSAGNYSVTITDANGCTQAATATITQPAGLNATVTTVSNVSCNGNNNGSVNVVANGGTSPYNYLWNPSGITTANATGLSAGNYKVVVTDANGCTLTSSTATITQPSALSAIANTLSNVSCNGNNNASADVVVNGGTPPYNYLWNPSGQTYTTVVGLGTGVYTITVTDANGCTASSTATISQPATLTATAATATNVSCNGDANGSASVSVNGGTSPYNYLWNPSRQTTASATGFSAGNYTVTVTDANGCTISSTATITQPATLNASATTLSNVSCNGDANGSANVVANGGTSPYNYLWNPSGITTANATGLSAGSYNVTVTDANGCTLTSSTVTITQPFALSASTNTLSNISCNGNDNGSTNVAANGGTSPYRYLWNPSGQTSANATGLSAGNYNVIVTDANGCSVTSSAVTITQPLGLSASATTVANVNCNGSNNASASVSVNGGTSPYNYLWNPSGQITATATGLSAGSYSITITDAHGCTASSMITITQPAILSASTATATNVNCNGDNTGSARVSASGGTTPYRYLWNPSGQADATAVGLSVGVYTVTVTDANGCTSIETATITQPLALVASISFVSNVSCNGSNNASASISVNGGTSPYRYLWSPSGQTTATATGLSPGIYLVTVTDSHGCTTTQQIIITQPAPLTVVLTGSQNFVCKGQPQQINAVAAGGTLPYTYLWSTGGNTSSITVIPVATTTYTITITDANGCSVTGTNTIIISSMSASTGQNSTICSGESATLTVYASGGGGEYTYLWLPGGGITISITVTPTITTIYTVIITDACSSIDTAYETVVVNPLPNMNFEADVRAGCSPLCVEFSNTCTISSGSITEWSWSFGDGSQANSKSAAYCYPNAGQYGVTLTATSNLGCSQSLEKPAYITVYATPKAEFVANPQPTTIRNPVIQFTNQTPEQDNIASWLWNFGATGDSNSSNAINPFHRYTDTGTYRVTLTVMSIHGCTDTVAHDVIIAPYFTLYFPNAFTPNGDGLNDTFYPKGMYVKTFEMYIYDRWGNQLFHTNDINQGWDGKVHGGGNISQEDVYVYIATATDVEGETFNYTGKVTLLK
jgi:large repetitive protein